MPLESTMKRDKLKKIYALGFRKKKLNAVKVAHFRGPFARNIPMEIASIGAMAALMSVPAHED